MANAGLAGLPIGLDCESCGQPITVDYIAHGRRGTGPLVSEAMQDVIKAAVRGAIARGLTPARCRACAPPAPPRRSLRAR